MKKALVAALAAAVPAGSRGRRVLRAVREPRLRHPEPLGGLGPLSHGPEMGRGVPESSIPGSGSTSRRAARARASPTPWRAWSMSAWSPGTSTRPSREGRFRRGRHQGRRHPHAERAESAPQGAPGARPQEGGVHRRSGSRKRSRPGTPCSDARARPRSTSTPVRTPAARPRPGPPTWARSRRTSAASASTATPDWPTRSSGTLSASGSTTSTSPMTPRASKPVEGIVICPIDINGNGKIDPGERLRDAERHHEGHRRRTSIPRPRPATSISSPRASRRSRSSSRS